MISHFDPVTDGSTSPMKVTTLPCIANLVCCSSSVSAGSVLLICHALCFRWGPLLFWRWFSDSSTSILSYSLRLPKVINVRMIGYSWISLHLQNLASLSSLASLKSIALSLSSEPLLSSFVPLHIAGHINTHDTPYNTAFYCLAFVYAMLVRTMELAYYRSTSVHATLVRTIVLAYYHSASVHATHVCTMSAGFCRSQSVHMWRSYVPSSTDSVGVAQARPNHA